MSTPIEASLAELCAKHDLTCIQVGINLNQAEWSRFGCTAHWSGYARRGIACATEHGSSVAEAIGKALTAVAAERGKALVSAPDLTMAEAA